MVLVEQSNLQVSIIIPAYNAGGFLAETLDTLLAQTDPNWEAVIVDDGSTDNTSGVAQAYAAHDQRFRIIAGPHQGVSTARNTGIDQARFEWLLFLDADDWIDPAYLERMCAVLEADSSLDAVHCGWARVGVDKAVFEKHTAAHEGILCTFFSDYDYFPVHACIVRKQIVKSVGGFDPALRTCEDWDLWLRVTRTGAHFGVVPEVLALYRTYPDSASVDPVQLLKDSNVVLERVYSIDPRIPDIDPSCIFTTTHEELVTRKYLFLSWSAGFMIGSGKDAVPLLSELKDERTFQSEPTKVAEHLFDALLVSKYFYPDKRVEYWSSAQAHIEEFLAAFEKQVQVANLAKEAINRLLQLIIRESSSPTELSIGSLHALRLDILKEIPDIHLPAEIERIACSVEAGGAILGVIELPVFDGRVPRYVLADAVSAELGWKILELYFQNTLYPGFKIEKKTDRVLIWQGETLLAEVLPDDDDPLARDLHEHVGWTLFLQEVWGCPGHKEDWFYNPEAAVETTVTQRADEGWLAVDVCEQLPDVACPSDTLQVAFSVGGAMIGVVNVPVQEGRVKAHSMRSALIHQSGFELCRAAVREGILGRPFDAQGSLKERLFSAYQLAAQSAIPPDTIRLPVGVEFSGLWQAGLSQGLSGIPRTAVLSRWRNEEIDTSRSRRAALPSSAYLELEEAAGILGSTVIQSADAAGDPARVIYVPELIRRFDEIFAMNEPTSEPPVQEAAAESIPFDRQMFEELYASQVNPWQYTTLYEQIKYRQTLEILPRRRYRHALELGCAEGHFTVQLAPRVDHLVAADISRVALERAAQRCAGFNNVQYLPFDLTSDPIIRPFDLIVCSEILYYVGSREMLAATAQKLTDALEPGGFLVMAHANLVVDEPDKPGFNWDHAFGAKGIGDAFIAENRLRLAKEIRTPLYRIHLFQRKSGFSFSIGKRSPKIIEYTEQPAQPPHGADADVLWQGGSPLKYESGREDFVTDALPILMYHRVAPSGSHTLAQYRVTPEQFSRQLAYLRDASYYTITIETWHAAMRNHKPLPGRAVLLTFDDGYMDFKNFAWPIMQRFGFSATVFLVAGEIGGSNRWDQRFGENLPLMGWEDILELSAGGIQFGSHTTSHPNLTRISPTEVVREAIESRMILERGLGRPVRAIAYPHGGEDPVIRHLAGGCGYIYGLTTRPGRAGLWEPLLGFPRIDVNGTGSLDDFIQSLT